MLVTRLWLRSTLRPQECPFFEASCYRNLHNPHTCCVPFPPQHIVTLVCETLPRGPRPRPPATQNGVAGEWVPRVNPTLSMGSTTPPPWLNSGCPRLPHRGPKPRNEGLQDHLTFSNFEAPSESREQGHGEFRVLRTLRNLSAEGAANKKREERGTLPTA